jgi:hypothetical protein
MKKNDIHNEVPKFWEGELVTGAVTILSGVISAAALALHVWADLETPMPELTIAFAILAGLFALLMAVSPMSLARAHGEAMEGGQAQAAILFIVFGLMIVDGALQVHAVSYLAKLMGIALPNIWILVGIAAVFQLSMFFIRGALFAASREIRELIEARQHDLAQAEIHVRAKLEQEAAQLGIQFDGRTSMGALRARVAAAKGSNVVNFN